MPKYLLPFTLVIFCYGCFAAGEKGGGNPEYKIISMYTDTPPVMDGDLEEAVWQETELILFEDDVFRNFPRKSENKVEVRTLWDETNLYIAFRVFDKDLQSEQTVQEHARISSDDIVEFLIDRSNKKVPCWNRDNIIYHINLNGMRKTDRGTPECTPDRNWDGNAEIAVQLFGTLNDTGDVDDGYIVEVAVSFEELGVEPFSGLRLGVDFANAENRIFFDWAGAKPFRSPESFGDLILSE
ncbi:MAG: sugar-binding protein [Balneolaceae bacterium]